MQVLITQQWGPTTRMRVVRVTHLCMCTHIPTARVWFPLSISQACALSAALACDGLTDPGPTLCQPHLQPQGLRQHDRVRDPSNACKRAVLHALPGAQRRDAGLPARRGPLGGTAVRARCMVGRWGVKQWHTLSRPPQLDVARWLSWFGGGNLAWTSGLHWSRLPLLWAPGDEQGGRTTVFSITRHHS